jgi:hypothetical protein
MTVRVTGLLLAYAFTSLTTIGAIFLLRAQVTPTDLQFFLGLLLISGVSAGFDSGTAKAALIRQAGGGPTAWARDILALSALKGAVASVPVGLIWGVIDPGAEIATLIWALPITVAGFISTDYRVSLDFAGRHQRALWMKQGSLALGILAAALTLLLNGSITAALVCSVLVRLVWSLAFIALATRCGVPWSPAAGGRSSLTHGVRALLGDPRWRSIFLISVLAAVSGNIDRFVVLRLLPSPESGDYFLWYEVITKFWLIPYVAGPILFAKRLRTGPSNALLFGSMGFTAAAGLVFLAALPAAVILAASWLPAPFNRIDGPTLLFALAIVVSALAQLMGADLQARGRQAYILFALFTVMVLTPLIFGLGATFYGVSGIYAGWLVKSGLELVLYGAPYLRRRAPPAR